MALNTINSKPHRMKVCTHDRGRFAAISNQNVLIYWPHGFGDWVQFSTMIQFLERSNRYWITRFGDDSVTLMEGHSIAQPIYLGINSPHCDDGGMYGIKHFGIKYNEITGGEMEVRLPQCLYDVVIKHDINVLFWTWYPESHGSDAVPFHTKSRAIIRRMTNTFPPHFNAPLPTTLNLHVEPAFRRMIEARLKNFCGYGERRLCLLGRGGYTSTGKNWGNLWRNDMPAGCQQQGHECRQFVKLMLAKSKHWCFLLMEDRNFSDSLKDPAINTFAYSDLFGEPETAFAPFGRVMKSLVKLASLCVGVPAGPYHLAAQIPELPTVGIWIEHLPSWYDEPRDGLVHLIGEHAAKSINTLGKPGSFLSHDGSFRFEARVLDTRTVSGEKVIESVESLISSGDW